MIYRFESHQPEIAVDAYVAPGACVIGQVQMLAQSSVWFNAVVRADNELIRIGVGSNIQDGAVLHTDPGLPLEIGDYVTVGHNAILHGCRVGNGSLIGMNTVILNRARIGNDVLIGANTLIAEDKDIPDGVLVLGSPGKIIRELTADERQRLSWSAKVYIDKIERYRRDLQAI